MLKVIESINPVSYVVAGIIVTAAAQIFLKKSSSFELMSVKWCLYLSLSLFSYFLSFVTYYLALRYFDISKISPIMMASIISIIALYGYWAGESMSLSRVFGIVLAVISIVFISRS